MPLPTLTDYKMHEESLYGLNSSITWHLKQITKWLQYAPSLSTHMVYIFDVEYVVGSVLWRASQHKLNGLTSGSNFILCYINCIWKKRQLNVRLKRCFEQQCVKSIRNSVRDPRRLLNMTRLWMKPGLGTDWESLYDRLEERGG